MLLVSGWPTAPKFSWETGDTPSHSLPALAVARGRGWGFTIRLPSMKGVFIAGFSGAPPLWLLLLWVRGAPRAMLEGWAAGMVVLDPRLAEGLAGSSVFCSDG